MIFVCSKCGRKIQEKHPYFDRIIIKITCEQCSKKDKDGEDKMDEDESDKSSPKKIEDEDT